MEDVHILESLLDGRSSSAASTAGTDVEESTNSSVAFGFSRKTSPRSSPKAEPLTL